MSDKSLGASIDKIVRAIFEKEDKRTEQYELQMVKRNREAQGKHSDGFFYAGNFHSDLELSLRAKGIKTTLHPNLMGDMDLHYQQKREVDFDKVRVKQALALLLNDCRCLQDIRDALPNSLATVVEGTSSLERTRPEGYTLENSERGKRQYQKLRDKIEFYMAMKLLY